MMLRKLILPTMIAAALAAPASAQDTQDGQAADRDPRKADTKAQQSRKDAQAPASKDRKEAETRKSSKAQSQEQPDEPEEDDR